MNELFDSTQDSQLLKSIRLNRNEILVLVDFYRNKNRSQDEDKRLDLFERSLRSLSREEYRQDTIF